MTADASTQDTGDNKPDLAGLIDDLLATPHAKKIAEHPEFGKVMMAAAKDDLISRITSKLQEALGKGTGVTKGRDSSEAVAKSLDDTPSISTASPAVAIPEAYENPALWKESLEIARKVYPDNTPDDMKARIEMARTRVQKFTAP